MTILALDLEAAVTLKNHFEKVKGDYVVYIADLSLNQGDGWTARVCVNHKDRSLPGLYFVRMIHSTATVHVTEE